jgi:hypothetical protein
MPNWPANSEAAGKPSQHYRSTGDGVFASPRAKFGENPTTNLASVKGIKEEMDFF